MSRLFSLLFIFGILFNGSGQISDSSLRVFKQAELQLYELQKKTFYSKKENERLDGNREFLSVWERIIKDPQILQYPFDSLKGISVLSPRDNKFKLITWNLHRDDGTHAFFGYLLVNNVKKIKKGLFKYEKTEEYESYKLLDRSATVKSPENYIGSPDKWFGMVYYQLVECDGYYTLIGWDGNDKLTQRKFIDVLYFRTNGAPVFGKDVFKFARKNPKRLMFEYSQEVSMSVRYNENQNRIVYSHLASKQEGSVLDGQFQYYGPDGSFDALELKKDKWVTVEDVDARNEKNVHDNEKRPDPKKHKKIMPGKGTDKK